MGMFFVTLTVLLTVYGQLILKWQVGLAGPLPADTAGRLWFLLGLLANPWVISGLAAAFGAALSWMLALTQLPLSQAYPFTALTFVLVLAVSVLFLHEPLTSSKAIGTMLIVAGIAVMASTGMRQA